MGKLKGLKGLKDLPGKAKGKAKAFNQDQGKKSFQKGYSGGKLSTAVGTSTSKVARGSGKASKAAGNQATKAKGSPGEKGAGPTKTRSAAFKDASVKKETFGTGRKRTTKVSTSRTSLRKKSLASEGFPGARGKTNVSRSVSITPKKRTAAYGGAAAGGYTTYKRKTKNGKVVTVRRKRG